MRSAAAPAAGLIALLMCLGTASPSAAQWRRIDSPNFIVVGEVGAGALRDVAVKFEAFRETLSRVLTERAISTAVPTVVLVVPNDRAFTPFKPKYQGKPIEVGGLFVPRRDVNYIAVISDGEPDRLRVVFHEFAHLVVSNTGRNVPVWLSEGLAEYYSTFELYRDGREAILGTPIDDHLARLNEAPLLPLEQLLSVDHESPLYNEGNRRSVFYAQSWALTHLILLGEPNRARELVAYLDHLSTGTPPRQAWQQAFAGQDLDRELGTYVRRSSFKGYRYRFGDKLATFDASATPMPSADAQAFLADFLLQQQRLDEAAQRLAAAPDSANVWVTVVAAQMDIEKRNYDAADKRLRALSTPADWLAAYRAGIAVADVSEEQGSVDVPLIETARRYFDAARVTRPVFANALARMADLELRSAAGPSSETKAAIERARGLVPGRHEYALLHAMVLAELSEFAAARSTLGPMLTGLYPPHVREAARSVMSEIVTLEGARAAAGRRDSVAAGAAPRTPAETSKPTGSTISERQPVFRVLQPGEQRTEGTLERIECSREGRAVFNVKTGDGMATFVAAELAGVDFITHRGDLSGSVGCGALKEPMAVYVTWRPAPDGSGAKTVVAIEFLPRIRPLSD